MGLGQEVLPGVPKDYHQYHHAKDGSSVFWSPLKIYSKLQQYSVFYVQKKILNPWLHRMEVFTTWHSIFPVRSQLTSPTKRCFVTLHRNCCHRAQCTLGFFLDVQEGNISCRTTKHKQKRQALHCQVTHHLNCDLISPSIGRRQKIPMIPVHSHHNLGKLKWFNMQNVLWYRERHWRSILLYSKYYLRNSKQKISFQQSQNSKTKECTH